MTWDEGCSRIKEDVRRIQRDEKRKVQAATRRLQLEKAKPKAMRADDIAVGVERTEEVAEARFRVPLTSSHESIRMLYQRISNW